MSNMLTCINWDTMLGDERDRNPSWKGNIQGKGIHHPAGKHQKTCHGNDMMLLTKHVHAIASAAHSSEVAEICSIQEAHVAVCMGCKSYVLCPLLTGCDGMPFFGHGCNGRCFHAHHDR